MSKEKSDRENNVNLITTLVINMTSFLNVHPIVSSGGSSQ